MSRAKGSLESRLASGKDDRSSKGPCLVCEEEADGLHYGIFSCRPCKTFFANSVQNHIEFKCSASNDCEITKGRRKSCGACRYNKCLRMGMIKEKVGLHKVVLEALKKSEPEALVAATGEGDIQLSVSEVGLLSKLSDSVGRELHATVDWAKQVPGFSELCINDKTLLLRTCWPEILSLNLAYRSMPLSEHLIFANDFVLQEKQGKALHAEELYSQCLKVVQRLDILQITSDEYYILKALVLVNSDVQLEDGAAVRKVRESLLTCLHDCVNADHSKPSQHVSNLLLCLPLLRQVDASVRRFWTNVRREGKVAMDELLVDMLETYAR